MKLRFGKKYYVYFNKKGIRFSCLTTKVIKKFENKQILVCYENVNGTGYFKVIDKRLKHFDCFQEHFYTSRFIMAEQLQLELEF